MTFPSSRFLIKLPENWKQYQIAVSDSQEHTEITEMKKSSFPSPLPFAVEQSAIRNPQWGNGGSGGARTRPESLIIKGLGGVPSQIASQKPVTFSHDLAQVVAAWGRLSAPLKAAILAIVKTTTNEGSR
ncbi:MAG: hypothetical protein ABSC18_12560 [Verrucomicrobiota bacterium]|jgi:hypothetical protein